MIEEFVIAARNGSWFQGGGRAGGGRDSLEEHLRARPDTLRGFSAAFSAHVGGVQDGAVDEQGDDAAQFPSFFTVRGQRFVVVSLQKTSKTQIVCDSNSVTQLHDSIASRVCVTGRSVGHVDRVSVRPSRRNCLHVYRDHERWWQQGIMKEAPQLEERLGSDT